MTFDENSLYGCRKMKCVDLWNMQHKGGGGGGLESHCDVCGCSLGSPLTTSLDAE